MAGKERVGVCFHAVREASRGSLPGDSADGRAEKQKGLSPGDPDVRYRRHTRCRGHIRRRYGVQLIAISDRQGWVFGETLEHALSALEREPPGAER